MSQVMYLGTLQAIGLQGYPSKDVIAEAHDAMRRAASAAVIEYGRGLMPWVEWPTQEETKKLREGELVNSSKDLIEAWIRHFEPENATAAAGAP